MKYDSIDFLGHQITGPFTIPSGIITTTSETLRLIASEIPQVGILTTKSIGASMRKGNREPVLALHGDDGIVNCIGLANPGVDEFARELKQIYPLGPGKFLMVSILGSSEEELVSVAEKLQPFCDGIELNFSCPHAEAGLGASIGTSPELSFRFTKAVKQTVSIPVFVKLPPGEKSAAVALACARSGADGIVAVNTAGPYENSRLSLGCGGLSGPPLFELGIKIIKEITQTLYQEGYHLPIIGVGGITDFRTVLAYREAGAAFFGVGTALLGMDTEEVKVFFMTLEKDLIKADKADLTFSNKDEDFFFNSERENLLFARKAQNLMRYHSFMISNVKWIDEDLKELVLDGDFEGEPGQFVFIAVSGSGEKPFSLADNSPVTIIVRRVGPFSSRLFQLEQGDEILLRGPYGKPLPLDFGKLCFVGGGTGLVPLLFAEKRRSDAVLFAGAKTGSQLSLIKKSGPNIILSTEDGTLGYHGMVTDALRTRLSTLQGYGFINCGPEMMMSRLLEIERHANPAFVICLIERYMKCGVGLCGSCAIDGWRTCVDGPYFEEARLASLNDFGRYCRDVSGKKISLGQNN